MLNLPNVLTLVRLALIPVFVILFYWPTESSNLLAAIVFIAAALTDLLDGFLARRLKQTTKFGAFLDPVADKIIVCTALILIVEFYSVHVGDFFPHMNLFVSIPAMIIVAREITVSALREWMAELGKRSLVAVSWVGKWKTTIQLVSIAGLIWRYNEVIIYGSLGMLAVATVLTIWSMVMYLKVGLINMRENAAEGAKPPESGR
ncbi:MAG: CDP-diacylglycerol--glycerol-3-phosphate 3-phosphatidyltransferase [Succinivibrio sp.]